MGWVKIVEKCECNPPKREELTDINVGSVWVCDNCDTEHRVVKMAGNKFLSPNKMLWGTDFFE